MLVLIFWPTAKLLQSVLSCGQIKLYNLYIAAGGARISPWIYKRTFVHSTIIFSFIFVVYVQFNTKDATKNRSFSKPTKQKSKKKRRNVGHCAPCSSFDHIKIVHCCCCLYFVLLVVYNNFKLWRI